MPASSVKGVSPFVATVLLIALTIAVSTVISFWLIPFITSYTESITREEEMRRECSKGGISLFDLRYNSTTSSIIGKIENTGATTLGNFSLEIIYTNFSIEKFDLCISGGIITKCSLSNLELLPRELVIFNLSISSNYDTVAIYTNCSKYGVYDKALSSEIL